MTAQSFVDTFNQEYQPGEAYNAGAYYGDSGIGNAWMKLIGYDASHLREFDKTMDDRAYERASINSARAWDEYMDSTKYQRAVEDMKAAGLNPWLAVQNGLPGTGAASVDTGGSARHQTHSNQSSSVLSALLIALARVLTVK